MSIWRKMRSNYKEVRMFGPQFLLRHTARLKTPRETIVRLPDIGKIWLRAGESDILVLRQVFVHHEYDIGSISAAAQRVDARYREILESGRKPVVIDAGANIGLSTLWFRKVYPEAAVVAIEPEPGNVSVLRRNVAGRRDIVVLESAVGSKSGFVEVANDGLGWAAQTERAPSGVPVVTIEEAIAQIEDGALFIVKIDIEGFESDLFSENLDWIDQTCMIFIEPHDWMLPGKRTSGSFQAAMGQRNFEIFVLGENLVFIRVKI